MALRTGGEAGLFETLWNTPGAKPKKTTTFSWQVALGLWLS